MPELPELFDRRLQARSLAYLFTAGAALTVITLILPHEAMSEPRMYGLAAAAVLIGALEYLRAGRARPLELHAALAAGTVIVTLANEELGAGSFYPMLYAWAVLYAFYFFPLPQALAQLAFAAACYAALLADQDQPSPLTRWLIVVGTPALAGLLVSRLLARLRVEGLHARERARALHESEARTRAIVEAAPEAFITIDRDGVVTAWNAAAERLFDWRASDAVGRPVRALIVPPEAREGFDERRERLLASPEALGGRVIEAELQRRDGRRFPAEASMSRIAVGDDHYLSGFVRDASERRRRQEEREALARAEAARAEAERVADMVSGTQQLVDAALAHRSLDEMLGDVVTRVKAVLRAEAVTLFLTEDGERLRLGASTTANGSAPPPPNGPGRQQPTGFGSGFAGRVTAERVPRLEHEPAPDDFVDPALGELRVDSAIGVPLRAESRVIGVIVVAAREPRRLTAEDLALLRVAAERVALAIEHARVYEREHRIAETLQRSLLPGRLPSLPGLTVAARYEPAAEEAEVGGDWYDVIPLPDGAVALVMGDVAGQGLAAASMVGRLRSALRAYALEGHEPATVIERLNRLVATEAEESHMATLVYLVLSEGTARWVNAGHLPPLVVGPDREARFLEGRRSPPLGVLPFAGFAELAEPLPPGATVLLYTDGLVERPGKHIDAGLARLAAVVRAAPPEADALVEAVLAAMVPAEGAADDVALLALSSAASSGPLLLELPSDPGALAALRAALRRWLRDVGAGARETAEVTTACGEAATNAIEHGGGPGDAAFAVEARLSGREVELIVRDSGAWRPPRPGDHGRGLVLMRALMDSVELERAPHGTAVTLRRRLADDGREPQA